MARHRARAVDAAENQGGRRGEYGATDLLTLLVEKANYGPRGEEIRLRWVDGVIRLADEAAAPVSSMDRKFRRHDAQQCFLRALDDLTEQKRSTSTSQNAANFAPRLIIEAGLNWFNDQEFSSKELRGAMNQLLKDKVIIGEGKLWPRDNRTWVTGIARLRPGAQPGTGAQPGWRKAADPAAGDAGIGCSIADRLATRCKLAFADGFLTGSSAPTGRDAADLEAHADDVAAFLVTRDRDFARVFD